VTYDGDEAPDPRAWAEADEGQRLRAVEAHHRAAPGLHTPTPNARVHAALHVVVETQLASGDPPEARHALARLVASGRSRHEAVHAIAAAAADALQAAVGGGRYDAAGYARALEALGRGPRR
jgi:ATP/maltotriose-dependent transcriptional regulator MalT